MLNQSKVTIESGVATRNILVDLNNTTSVSCKVANTGVSADASGKKIVKAGTPVKGSLTARDTDFTVAVDGEDAVGVILHDVDVTEGTANSQVVVSGLIDLTKVDTDVAEMLTAAEANLKMIQLVK